jgi:hypothetical protein
MLYVVLQFDLLYKIPLTMVSYEGSVIDSRVLRIDKQKVHQPKTPQVLEKRITTVFCAKQIMRFRYQRTIRGQQAKGFHPKFDGRDHIFADAKLNYGIIIVKIPFFKYKIIPPLQPVRLASE